MKGAWTAEPSPKEFMSLLIRAKRKRTKESGSCTDSGQNWHKSSSNLVTLAAHRSPTPDNTPFQSRQNAKAHYDLGNELFQLFLDPSMTYSSAFFGGFPQKT